MRQVERNSELHEVKVVLVQTDTKLRRMFGLLKACDNYGVDMHRLMDTASRKVAGRSLYSSDRPETKDYDGVFSGRLGAADIRNLSDAVSARLGQQFSFFTHRIRRLSDARRCRRRKDLATPANITRSCSQDRCGCRGRRAL